jgi:hypothetical protein
VRLLQGPASSVVVLLFACCCLCRPRAVLLC